MSTKKILLTQSAFQKLKEQEQQWQEKLKKIKKRYSADVKGSWGGSASKDQAQQNMYYAMEKLREIHATLKNCQVIESAERTNNQFVGLGSKVTALLNNEKQTFEITTEFDSNPAKGRLAYTSPVAQTLLGKKKGWKGSVQTPQGEIELELTGIIK